MQHHRISAAVLFLAFLAGASLFAQEVAITPNQPSGLYTVRQSVRWSIEVKGDQPLTGVKYAIRKGGLNVLRQGDLPLADHKAVIEASSDEPGWLLLEVEGLSGQKKIKKLGGALFSGEQIKPAMPAPDDFDAFWAEKLKELAQTPVDATLEKGDSGKAGVDYYAIAMKNIRGSSIQGQLARPAGGEKFPALLIVQWAGVYPLQKPWVTDRAAEGWLALNIQAHDLPAMETAEFYKKQSEGPLKDYPAIGADSRETSYFLRMYLSCYRAAEYLTTRPDWNGQVLVVTGGSQGGLQALVTAALHPRVTGAAVCVPAGCDNTSLDAQRAPGWPKWPYLVKGRDAAKVKETSRYFDVVNFAPRVKCPVLIGVGGIDTTCPAPGIYAAANQIPAVKEIVFMPLADHAGRHDAYYARLGPWMTALRAGKAPQMK